MKKVSLLISLLIILVGSAFANPEWKEDQNGCLHYNPEPVSDEVILWSGKCSNGYGSGDGAMTFMSKDGDFLERLVGTEVKGKFQGRTLLIQKDRSYKHVNIVNGAISTSKQSSSITSTDKIRKKIEYLRFTLNSVKLKKQTWGDLGDNVAELKLILISESYTGKKTTLTIPTNEPLPTPLNKVVNLNKYSGFSIPITDKTMRVYIFAVDNDEKYFTEALAESAAIKFIGKHINKDAAKFLYKVKNGNWLAWAISTATEEGLYVVRDYLQTNDIIGPTVVEINGNQGWNHEKTESSTENTVEFEYTTYREKH